MILLNGAQQLGCARLGWRTAKEWLADDWQRKLGLKSMCADHGCRLTRNVLEISTIDANKRRFLIHFEQNSPATKEVQ